VRWRHAPQLTCNLFRSFPNCWNPSSSVTKVAESFEDAELRACITRFLSNKVFSRSLSFGAMSEASKRSECPCYLCFLLKVEDIDLLKFALLTNNVSAPSMSSNEHLAHQSEEERSTVSLQECLWIENFGPSTRGILGQKPWCGAQLLDKLEAVSALLHGW